MEKVFVVGPFNQKMREAIRENLPEQFSLDFVRDKSEYSRLEQADYVIIRTLTMTAEDIALLKNCKLIQRWGVGYDSIDIEAAAKKKIPVAVCFGINAVPVAEMTLALTLAVLRNVVPLTVGIHQGLYERETYSKTAWTIHNKTVGVIGTGNIGIKAAALYKAFGASVLYCNACRLTEQVEKDLGLTYMELDGLLGRCDIVSLHVPLTASTERMINSQSIAKMKDGAVLINTAREELIDYQALKEALESGKLRGVGLDAIEEGSVAWLAVRGLENVVLTAHVGGNTSDNVAYSAQRCAEQIVAVSSGKKLSFPHVVNGVSSENNETGKNDR